MSNAHRVLIGFCNGFINFLIFHVRSKVSQLHYFYESKLMFEQSGRNLYEVILTVFYNDSLRFLGRSWKAPDARKELAEDHKTIAIYSTLITFLICRYSVEELNHLVIFRDLMRFKAFGRLHII